MCMRMMRINSACGVVVGRLDEGEWVRERAEVWNDNRNVVGLDYCLGVGLVFDWCLIGVCLGTGLVFV